MCEDCRFYPEDETCEKCIKKPSETELCEQCFRKKMGRRDKVQQWKSNITHVKSVKKELTH